MPTKLSNPTGSIFVRAFDEGMFLALGAVLRTANQTTINRDRKGYWIDDVFTAPVEVPVIWNNPEQIYEFKIYPCYHIRRNDIQPALSRWHSIKSLEYVAGVSGAEVVDGVSGYSTLEMKSQAWPHDLFYTVACYARYEHEAVPMMKRLLKTFPSYGTITVLDSLGQQRRYSVFNESGVQDISDFVDVADRLKAFSIDIRIEAELDLREPVTIPSVGSIDTTINKR